MAEKAFISQPMNGLSDEEIKLRRDEATKYLEGHGYEVISSYFSDTKLMDDRKHPSVAYLGASILLMSNASIVYFLKGWENARGCRIEERIASNYGITCMYER